MKIATSARAKIAHKLLGDDVFISYSRADGATYAALLASELTKRKLSCRIDQWGSQPGKDLPPDLLRALRRSSMLVVVGSAGAASSAAVEREVLEFRPTGRFIVPIDIDGSIRSARWWPSLEGLAVAQETELLGKPSEETIQRIVGTATFTRRNARLARYAMAALVVFIVLAVLALWQGQRVLTETRKANAAEDASQQAEHRRVDAEQREGQAKEETARQRDRAAAADQEREVSEAKRDEVEAQLEVKRTELGEQTAIAEAREYRRLLPVVAGYLRDGRLDLARQMLDQAPIAPRAWEWGYYREQLERDLLTLTNRDESVELPQGRLQLAFSDDGTLGIRDSVTGRRVRRLGMLRSCAASRPWVSHFTSTATTQDGALKAQGQPSGSILLFQRDAIQPFQTIQAHQEPVAEVHFSPDGRLLVSRCGFAQAPPDKSVPDDHSARVWEVPTGRLLASLEDGSRPVIFTLFSPDSRRVLTSSVDDISRLWDSQTGGLLARLVGHTSEISEASFSDDGRLILTSSGYKCSAKLWANGPDQTISLAPARPEEESQFDPRHVALPGKSIDVEKNVVTILDYELPEPYLVREFKGHTADIVHARFLENGRTLLTVSLDHTARIWDVGSGNFRVIPVGGDANTADAHGGHFQDLSAAVLLDGRQRLLTAAHDGFVKIWNVKTGRCAITIDWIGEGRRKKGKQWYQTNIFRLSRDRKFIAIQPSWGAGEPTTIWDLATGALVSSLSAPGRELKTVDFSPDSTRLVTVTDSLREQGYETPLSWTALVWDVQQGQVVATLTLDGDRYVGAREKEQEEEEGERGATRMVSNLVDTSLRLDEGTEDEIQGALSSGVLYAAEFDAEGKSIFALVPGEKEVRYRIWEWAGLPPRLIRMQAEDFWRELRAWKLTRLLEYLGEGAQ